MVIGGVKMVLRARRKPKTQNKKAPLSLNKT